MARPLQTIILLATIAGPAVGQGWTALGVGVDGPVYCLAVYKNELYAGGRFTTAGVAPAANIARWNGVGWSSLGSGTNGAVHALFVYDGELHVGGDFTSCGGMACNHVARWDGSGWTPVGSGLNGPVFSMVDYQGVLYIGGDFTRAGTRSVNHIAAWDGGGWRDVSGGVNNTVHVLTVTDASDLYADLYVGGAFVLQDLSRIAWYHPAYQAWRATVWGGFDAPVFAFANYAGGLVAGGSFASTGAGASASRLAQRGNDFNGGADGAVYTLHAEESDLYVGGFFTSVGPAPGVAASNIAKWDGSRWEALGSGTDNSVRAIVVFQEQLYAGGEFEAAGGMRVNHVARWGAATEVTSTPPAIPAVVTLQSYPNPFNPSTTIKYELHRASVVRLSVHNILGREVSILMNEKRGAGVYEVNFDASNMPSGIYLCRLQAGDHLQSCKLVLLR